MLHLRHRYGSDPEGRGFFWPASEQKRAEAMGVKRNRPVDFQSIYQCAPGAREGTIFLESDFAYFNAPEGIDAGVAEPGVRAFVNRGHQLGRGLRVDLTFDRDADLRLYRRRRPAGLISIS